MNTDPCGRDGHPSIKCEFQQRRRKVLWIVGLIAINGLIGFWFWWMTWPAEIQTPIATIPLSDGSELRLIHYFYGNKFEASGLETFGGRLPQSPGSNASDTKESSNHDNVWLVFTQFRPEERRFSFPLIDGLWFTDQNSSQPHRAEFVIEGSGAFWQALHVDVSPLRALNWRIRVVTNPDEFESVESLGEFIVPDSNSIVAIDVPAALREEGVSDMFFVGRGKYAGINNTLTPLSGTNLQSPLKFHGRFPDFSHSCKNPGILLFRAGTINLNLGPARVLAKIGSNSFISFSEQSQSKGGLHMHYYGFNGELSVGANVTFELLKPRFTETTFSLPPPSKLR